MSVAISIQPTDPFLKIAPAPFADRAKKVGIGCVTWLVMSPVGIFLYQSARHVASLFDPKALIESTTPPMWNKVGAASHPLLILAWRVFVLLTVVVVGPILEECLFREKLEAKLREWTHIPALRIGMNGLLFGLIHVWRFPIWALFPKFVITTFGGCVAAALREKTGDIIAPSAAHILHNGVAIGLALRL
jgi:membrane protease YdiL (CAAX protease family)